VKKLVFFVSSASLFLSSFLPAQTSDGLGAKRVQDYFQDVESKSYYQQERIRSVKGEMNEYSERLHSLQEKFHQIFYGKSSNDLHQSPFGKNEKVSYPKRTQLESKQEPKPKPVIRPSPPRSNYQRQSNQLAFNVGQSSSAPEPKPQPVTSPERNPSKVNSVQTPPPKKSPSAVVSNLGGYLIIRPGFTIPFKGRKSHNGVNHEKHREYDPGASVMFSGGYRYSNWKFGAGLLYRENDHHGDSYERNGLLKKPFGSGSDSRSIAGFLEVGYTHSLNHLFGLYGSLGLGYGASIVEDYAPYFSGGNNRTRIDPFFFLTTGFGVSYTPNDFISIDLGYRYLHEDEVPAHAIEFGFQGKF
jgi:hypothetical protein